MKKNTMLAVIVVALGLALSYISINVTDGWKVMVAGFLAFSALVLASFSEEV